jgi:hypothetical protein
MSPSPSALADFAISSSHGPQSRRLRHSESDILNRSTTWAVHMLHDRPADAGSRDESRLAIPWEEAIRRDPDLIDDEVIASGSCDPDPASECYAQNRRASPCGTGSLDPRFQIRISLREDLAERLARADQLGVQQSSILEHRQKA